MAADDGCWFPPTMVMDAEPSKASKTMMKWMKKHTFNPLKCIWHFTIMASFMIKIEAWRISNSFTLSYYDNPVQDRQLFSHEISFIPFTHCCWVLMFNDNYNWHGMASSRHYPFHYLQLLYHLFLSYSRHWIDSLIVLPSHYHSLSKRLHSSQH